MKFASAATDAMNVSDARSAVHRCRSQPHRRVVDRPKPSDQAAGGRADYRSVLKSLIGLLHQGSAVLAEPAHHRPVGRFVDSTRTVPPWPSRNSSRRFIGSHLNIMPTGTLTPPAQVPRPTSASYHYPPQRKETFRAHLPHPPQSNHPTGRVLGAISKWNASSPATHVTRVRAPLSGSHPSSSLGIETDASRPWPDCLKPRGRAEVDAASSRNHSCIVPGIGDGEMAGRKPGQCPV